MDRRLILEDLKDPLSGHVRVDTSPYTPKERCQVFVGSVGLIAALIAFFITQNIWLVIGTEIAVMVPLKRYHALCDLD